MKNLKIRKKKGDKNWKLANPAREKCKREDPDQKRMIDRSKNSSDREKSKLERDKKKMM